MVRDDVHDDLQAFFVSGVGETLKGSRIADPGLFCDRERDRLIEFPPLAARIGIAGIIVFALLHRRGLNRGITGRLDGIEFGADSVAAPIEAVKDHFIAIIVSR